MNTLYTKNMPKTAYKRSVMRNNFILMAMCAGFGYLVVLGLLDTFNGVMWWNLLKTSFTLNA